ncbi:MULTISPECIES: hypothetical protein [unclassified Bradyrhizobium]|uniref:hypothetical protein n=1 Tax=unclassified Bradyrhizobium TaxID=2631580 RepID=UPI0028E9EC64|nr:MULTISPECIES: hypothetical protein [unclassified Bradyrhizobium]
MAAVLGVRQDKSGNWHVRYTVDSGGERSRIIFNPDLRNSAEATEYAQQRLDDAASGWQSNS